MTYWNLPKMDTSIKAKPVPRGIRNNNPGNIRWGDDWQGLTPLAQRTDPAFCQFIAPEWGIRAMAKVLLKYGQYNGTPGVGEKQIDTVTEIINRWAPPVENDTGAYVNSVASHLGVPPTQHIELTSYAIMAKLVEAIVQHENGQQPYSDKQILDGLRRAGYNIP